MAAYRDPHEIKMENGRSMADYIRSGPAGLKGVVIAKATPGGTPTNFDPHDMSRTKINVVDRNGASVADFSAAQMTEDRVQKAIEIANAAIQGDDIESIRERAAMVFEEMAKMSKSSVQRVPVKTSAAAKPIATQSADDIAEREILTELETEIQQPPLEKVDRSYSPMAAFGFKKKTNPLPAAAGGHGVSGRAGPPQKLVYFEKEGIGTVPAFFHDVIVAVYPVDEDGLEESGFMVLIYDLRFEQNAARWFPPSNDPYGRPWAVKINDDNRLYLVNTTGFQYVYDGREYCILAVERAIIASGE
jgi:hypothetical protein